MCWKVIYVIANLNTYLIKPRQNINHVLLCFYVSINLQLSGVGAYHAMCLFESQPRRLTTPLLHHPASFKLHLFIQSKSVKKIITLSHIQRLKIGSQKCGKLLLTLPVVLMHNTLKLPEGDIVSPSILLKEKRTTTPFFLLQRPIDCQPACVLRTIIEFWKVRNQNGVTASRTMTEI